MAYLDDLRISRVVLSDCKERSEYDFDKKYIEIAIETIECMIIMIEFMKKIGGELNETK